MTLQPNTQNHVELLTPAAVAAVLFVDPKTVTRWARAGKIDAILTPGGHRRYRKSDVTALMAGGGVPAQRTPSRPPSARPVSPGEGRGTSEDLTVLTEAAARALEREAVQASEGVLVARAALESALENAARAAARAREARAFASADPGHPS